MSGTGTGRKFLFVRMDRIGDLVLTLPVDEALIDTQVDWWIPRGLSFITEHAEPPRRSREVARVTDRAGFLALLRDVKREKYDGILIFHAPWWVSFLAWLARIPWRAGVKSQWHSFLFLNRGVRQKRSRADHSELEYNYLLLEEALGVASGTFSRKTLVLRADGGDVLARHGLLREQYDVVHPGMGGSALNWPIDHFAELVRSLKAERPVVITGTAADREYTEPLRAQLGADQTNIIWLNEKLSGAELLAVLTGARSITAPSTGVLHLAASVGRPTVGLFSPVRVQQPKRWGPRGPRTSTLMPGGECPGSTSCLGKACPRFSCMREIPAASVLENIRRLLDSADAHRTR